MIVEGRPLGFVARGQADSVAHEADRSVSRDAHEKASSSSDVPSRRRSLTGDGRRELEVGNDAAPNPTRVLRRPASMASMRSMAFRSPRPVTLLRRPDSTCPGQRLQHRLFKGNSVDSNTKPRESVRPQVPPRIPRLVLFSLTPKMRLPKMTQLWAFLDRIECITVGDVYTTTEDEDSKGIVHYVLNVYTYREHRRIPTRRTHRVSSSPPPPPAREPDVQVPHRFSSFRTLQSRIRKATRSKHVPHRYDGALTPRETSHRDCVYCQRIRSFVANASESVAALGWRAKLSGTVEARREQLGRIVSELLCLVREQRTQCSNLEMLTMLHQPSSAYVDTSVPGILRRFLTAQTGENFMR